MGGRVDGRGERAEGLGGNQEPSGLASHSVGLVIKIRYVSVCMQPALFNSMLLK